MSRLMADFFSILNRLNMEDVLQQDPKKVVSYLADALRPWAFKWAAKDPLGRSMHKLTRSNLQVFLYLVALGAGRLYAVRSSYPGCE